LGKNVRKPLGGIFLTHCIYLLLFADQQYRQYHPPPPAPPAPAGVSIFTLNHTWYAKPPGTCRDIRDTDSVQEPSQDSLVCCYTGCGKI